MIRSSFLLVALAALALAQDSVVPPFAQPFQSRQSTRADARADRADARVDSDYQKGLQALDAQQWDQAIALFKAAAEQAVEKGSAADASLYWNAYAQDRAGRLDQALAEIKALRDSYPDSRWLRDAKALELEVRAQTGAPVSPAAEQDEDLKLMALNNIMQADPDKALPILQKLLAGNNSPKLKERALFVLTQSSSPDARKMLLDAARNSSNPDLQLKAIRYLGMMGNADARKELASIYTSSADPRVKQAIIRQLAVSGAQDELWQLYQSESSIENKQAILQSLYVRGNSSKLVDVARTEKDPRLRIAAIRSLGLMHNDSQSDVLVSIYQSDQNREVRDAVINALFLQHNGKALVDLARNEKDPQMKMDIVKKMSLIHSKEVTDYMVELLK